MWNDFFNKYPDIFFEEFYGMKFNFSDKIKLRIFYKLYKIKERWNGFSKNYR